MVHVTIEIFESGVFDNRPSLYGFFLDHNVKHIVLKDLFFSLKSIIKYITYLGFDYTHVIYLYSFSFTLNES